MIISWSSGNKSYSIQSNLQMAPGGFQFWKKVFPNSLDTMEILMEVDHQLLSDS